MLADQIEAKQWTQSVQLYTTSSSPCQLLSFDFFYASDLKHIFAFDDIHKE